MLYQITQSYVKLTLEYVKNSL